MSTLSRPICRTENFSINIIFAICINSGSFESSVDLLIYWKVLVTILFLPSQIWTSVWPWHVHDWRKDMAVSSSNGETWPSSRWAWSSVICAIVELFEKCPSLSLWSISVLYKFSKNLLNLSFIWCLFIWRWLLSSCITGTKHFTGAFLAKFANRWFGLLPNLNSLCLANGISFFCFSCDQIMQHYCGCLQFR